MASNGKKAALVTGAATGIGSAAAIALARAGYDVAVNYSRSSNSAAETAAECEKAGAKAFTVQADVADDAVKRMVGEVEKRFGRLDALINNAGTTMETEPKDFDGVDVAQWKKVFDTNVLGIFLTTRAATPLLKKSG